MRTIHTLLLLVACGGGELSQPNPPPDWMPSAEELEAARSRADTDQPPAADTDADTDTDAADTDGAPTDSPLPE